MRSIELLTSSLLLRVPRYGEHREPDPVDIGSVEVDQTLELLGFHTR